MFHGEEKGRKSGKRTESLSALGKETPARKIVNEKANSQIGFIFGAIVVIIIIVIILLAILPGNPSDNCYQTSILIC